MHKLNKFNRSAISATGALLLSIAAPSSFAALSDYAQLNTYFADENINRCYPGFQQCIHSYVDYNYSAQVANNYPDHYTPTDAGFELQGVWSGIDPSGNNDGREYNIDGHVKVSFTVLSETLFHVGGELVGNNPGIHLSLQPYYGTYGSMANLIGGQSVAINQILTPGKYSLLVLLTPNDDLLNDSLFPSYDLNASFSAPVLPTPIPAAAWLFGSALGLLVNLKRNTIA